MPFPDQTASTLAAPSPRSAPLDPSGFDVGQFRDMADSLGNLTIAPQAPDATSSAVPRFQAPADNLYTIDPSQFTGLADTIQKQYGISNDDVTQHLSDSGFTPEQIKAMPQEHIDQHRTKLAEYGPSSTAKPLPISGARDADAAELEQLRAEVHQRIERNGTLYDPKFVGKFGRIEQLKTRMKSKYPALTKTPAFKAFDAETNKWFVKTQQRQQKVDQNEIKTLQEQNPTLLAGNELGGIAQGILGGGVQLASPVMRAMGQGEEADRILQKSKALQAAQQANVKANGYGYVRGTLNEVLPGASQSLTEAAALGPIGRLAKTAKGAYALGSAMMAAGFGVTTANDTYSEGKQAGLSTKEAAKYAAFQGGLEAGIMLVFQGLGSKIAGLEGVQRLLLPAGKELSKQTGKQTLWMMAKGLIGETLEENTTTILQQINTAATLPGAEDSANWINPKKEGFASVWDSPMMLAIRQTTAQTVLMMGMAEGVSGAAKLLRSRAKAFAADPSARNYEKAVEAGLPPNETPPNRAERADMADALHHMIDGLKHPYSADKSQQPGEEVIPPSATEGEAAQANPPSESVVPNQASEPTIALSGETLNATQNQEAQQVPEVRQDKLQVQVPLLSTNDNAGAVDTSSDPELTAPAESLPNPLKAAQNRLSPDATPQLGDSEAQSAPAESSKSLSKVSEKSVTFQNPQTTGWMTDGDISDLANKMWESEDYTQTVSGGVIKKEGRRIRLSPDGEGNDVSATFISKHRNDFVGADIPGHVELSVPIRSLKAQDAKNYGILLDALNSQGVGDAYFTVNTKPSMELIAELKRLGWSIEANPGNTTDDRGVTQPPRGTPSFRISTSRPQKPTEALDQPAVATGGTVASPAQESPPASGEASAVSPVEQQFNDLLASGKSMDEAVRIIAAGSKKPETPTAAEKIDEPRSSGAKPSTLDRMKQRQEKANVEAIPSEAGKAKAVATDTDASARSTGEVSGQDRRASGKSKSQPVDSAELDGLPEIVREKVASIDWSISMADEEIASGSRDGIALTPEEITTLKHLRQQAKSERTRVINQSRKLMAEEAKNEPEPVTETKTDLPSPELQKLFDDNNDKLTAFVDRMSRQPGDWAGGFSDWSDYFHGIGREKGGWRSFDPAKTKGGFLAWAKNGIKQRATSLQRQAAARGEIQAEEGSLENVPVRGTSRNASIDASSASNPAPTNVNTSGAATPINRPTPVTQPSPATQQVIARRIPMPELVEMVTHLIGHVPMVGHRLRKALGVAKLSEGTMDAEILLRPDIAKDPKQLARTLAHEIGHLIDWFPNFTMKRGNILGRIGVLRNYLKSMLDALPTNPSRALTPQARRVIRMAAEQSAGPRPAITDTAATQAWRDAVADEYQRIIQDYVTRNDMLTKEAMKEELIGLSEWWKPYDHNAVDPSYVQYRESSRELYADALSVLLSAPSEVAQRAPTFWRSWLGYLDQKPEVSEKIIELWDRLGGTPQEIAARRTERRKEGFIKGSEAYTSALQARIDAEQSTWMKAKSIILQGLLDKHAPINAIAADIGDTNAIHIIDELNQVNNDLYLFFKDTDDNIVKPMLDEGFTTEEIWDEIGEYLIDNRIIKEVAGEPKLDKHGDPIEGTEAKARWEIMNPHGFTRTESIEQMTEQVRRLGKHKFNVLRDRMKAWHRDILWPHIAEAGNVGVYSQDKVTNDLAKNKDAYAAFAVVRYIDDHVSPMLKQQVGTFEDVGNPFHFTMLKFMSLIRLNQLNKAKNVVLDDLLPSVDGVKKLDVAYGHTKPSGKPEPGNEWITRLVDGKVEWYEVPSNVAAAFDSHDVGMISDIANALSGPMYSVFHPLYVVFSPGFVTANPFRDMSRTYKNLGATHGVTAREVLTEYLKAIPAAIQHAKGKEIAQVHEMLKDKAWGIPWHSLTESQLKVVPMGVEVNRNWSDRLMDSKEWYNKYNPLLQFFKAVRFVGQVEEAAGKISAYNLLGNKGVTGKQRAYDVRKITSTPDWTQSGLLTKFTNLVWMYSRIGFNALQTSAQLATNNYPGHKNTAAGWWWRSAVMTALPVLITKAIMMVDPDDEEYPEELRALSRLLRRIPAYFRENYLSVPFGERTNSEGVKETIFMSIPLNPEDAFLAKITGALFDAMHIVAGGKPRETRSIRQAAGKVASGVADLAAPNLSPPINTGITWIDYLTGKTPKDRFRDTPVIPKRTPEGWESDKKMIQWTINQFGVVAQLAAPATNAMFGEEFSDRKMSTGEAIVDGALKASGAGRIFRHSGRGQDEADWVDFERESQQRKELRAAYVPPAINRINSELSRLRGIPAAELSPTQMQRRKQLSIFDSAVVQPLSEGAANKSPEQLSALKATLNSASAIAGSLSSPSNPLRMTSPPPEIAPLVNDFKYRLVMAAIGQISTEDEKEGGDKRDPNIIAARELLKEIAPTADERRELFRKAYRDKHGHFPSDMSPVRRLKDYYDKPAK